MLVYKYFILILLVGGYFLTELIVGLYANSITLQTDAFHMLSDLLSLLIGGGSLLLLSKERSHRYTYGWVRAEIIGGLINSVFLLSICFTLAIENITKLIELGYHTSNDQLTAEIDLVLYVAIGGLLVNFIGICLFYNEHSHAHGHSHSHNHTESPEEMPQTVKNYAQYAVLLHILGDALGSILVITSSLLIKFVKTPAILFLDPIASLCIVSFIGLGSAKLLRDCIKILLHHWAGTPTAEITNSILRISGVTNVHDFHIWSLDGKISVASMHVLLGNSDNTESVIVQIKDILHSVGIHSSCIQPEWSNTCIEPTCNSACKDLQCCSAF